MANPAASTDWRACAGAHFALENQPVTGSGGDHAAGVELLVLRGNAIATRFALSVVEPSCYSFAAILHSPIDLVDSHRGTSVQAKERDECPSSIPINICGT